MPALEYAAKAATEHSFLAPLLPRAHLLRQQRRRAPITPSAYELFRRIAEEHAEMDDPDDDRRAPFVAKAMTRSPAIPASGIPAIGLMPDKARAAEYLHNAASVLQRRGRPVRAGQAAAQGRGR